MEEKIKELLPELAEIEDDALRDKVVATYQAVGMASRAMHKCQGMARLTDPIPTRTTRWHWAAASGEAIGEIELMAFDTLCSATMDYPLGDGPIPGSIWSGVGVTDGSFTPEGLVDDEFTTFPLTYSASVGVCTADAQTVIRVGDPIIDTTGFVALYCADGDPVQFTARPLGGSWPTTATPWR